jgi:RHS repeat-associated protein
VIAPARFSGSPLSGAVPLEVTFTDASSGTVGSWSWDFGDGVTNTATNPAHVYTRIGVYTVSLAVSGPCGSDALTRTNYVTVGSRVYVTTTRVITYIYDPLNRLISATYSTGEQFGYGYDAVGNRTVYTATAPLAGTTVTTYTYDAANRLLVSQSPGHLVTTTWDARGNLVSNGTFTYTYNAAGRMVRAEGVTLTLVYTYNASGLRVARSVNGEVTSFAWDWASGVPEMLSEGQAMRSSIALYLVGHETLGRRDGADWTYYLPDALGSIRQETDGSGDVTDSREWTPFGVEVGTAQEGLGYAGEWLNTYANQAMLYLRARWYEPHTGRFTSPDTIIPNFRNPQSANRYLYALANPTNLIDPAGLYSIAEIKEIFNNAPFYDPDVLDYFESGRLLEGRWGWLKVLRVAANGDRLVVYDRVPLGCCEDDPGLYGGIGGCVWGPEYRRQDIGGEFQKMGQELLIGGDSHWDVAVEGHRYEVFEITQRLPDLPYDRLDPIIQHPVFKANIVATYQYKGIQCDGARADLVKAIASVISLALPVLGVDEIESGWALRKQAILVMNAQSREGADAALQAFVEESNLLLLKLQVKYRSGVVDPRLVLAIDILSDVKSLIESGGCSWLP